MSNVLPPSFTQLPPSLPYFVIREDDCMLDWLIKRILLIFQGCYSPETINASIASFSTTNIQWLTPYQIQHLQEECLQQLSQNQLLAFSQNQIALFSNSQHRIYQLLLRGEEGQVNPPHFSNLPDTPFAPEGGDTSLRIQADDQSVQPQAIDDTAGRQGFTSVTRREVELRLEETDLKHFLGDPAVRSSLDQLLPEEDRAFFSHSMLRDFVDDRADKYDGFTLSAKHRELLKNDVLFERLIVDFVRRNGIDETTRDFLRSAMTVENADYFSEEKLEGLSRLLYHYSNITPYQRMRLSAADLFRFMITPKDLLLDLPLRAVWHMSVSSSAYLSSKINDWTAEETGDECAWDDDQGEAQPLSALTISALRSMSSEKINAFLRQLPAPFMNLLSKKQLSGLQTDQLSKEQVNALFEHASLSAGFGKEFKLFEPFSPQQIRAMQGKMSGASLKHMSTEQMQLINALEITPEQVEGLFPHHSGDFEPCLAKFSPGQIRQMQDKLSGDVLLCLNQDQLRVLDFESLTQLQIDRLITGPFSHRIKLWLSEPQRLIVQRRFPNLSLE